MKVTFEVKFDKTTDEHTTIYLWAYKGWWIFPGWWGFDIIRSERVSIDKAQSIAEQLLKDAEKWYKIYNNSPSGCMYKKCGSNEIQRCK
jgi:hypothetical protein